VLTCGGFDSDLLFFLCWRYLAEFHGFCFPAACYAYNSQSYDFKCQDCHCNNRAKSSLLTCFRHNLQYFFFLTFSVSKWHLPKEPHDNPRVLVRCVWPRSDNLQLWKPLLIQSCINWFPFLSLGLCLVFFNWSLFDLQDCVNFCCTAEWLSYTHICILFHILFIMLYHKILKVVLCAIQ